MVAFAEELPVGRVVCETPRSVHDGDTFRCLSAGRDFPVRVAGIDAPETGQAFWRVSRDLLRARAVSGTVIDCYKADRFGRQVCRVEGPEGKDVALELVSTGLAWRTRKYAAEQTLSERETYSAAEEAARRRGLGLWSQPDPQAPEVCRELKNQRQKCR